MRLSRNKKSARSKGYGFVEFSSKEVAAIAGEAMDGYMMFSQKLSVNVVPQKEIHPQLFKGEPASGSRVYVKRAICSTRAPNSSPIYYSSSTFLVKAMMASCHR